jgi:RNA polymerase sigma-70 factor (ECF subfamily)
VTEPHDREVIERQIRAFCGDDEHEKAATLLVETYGREIFRFVLTRVRDEDGASEVFSQFTEDLWRGLRGFRWQCSARTWSYILARHAASRYVADEHRRRQREEPVSRLSILHDVEQKIRTETLAAARTEAKTRVAELREQLPLDDQTLLVLRINRGLDWKELARVMIDEGEAATDGAIEKEAARLRKRFQSIKEKLRQMASDAGLVNDEPGPSEK